MRAVAEWQAYSTVARKAVTTKIHNLFGALALGEVQQPVQSYYDSSIQLLQINDCLGQLIINNQPSAEADIFCDSITRLANTTP